MNQLYLGNNLEVLRHHIPDHSVDLIYLDPPFGSHTDYHSGPATHRRTAFVDTWTWNQDTLQHLAEIHRHQAVLGDLLDTITRALHYNGLAAYLVMMTIRLWELHRVLKPRGSFYLHCDPTANGYLRVILDTIFGPENFRSEIVWKRTSNHNDSKKWPRVHDTILFYAGKGFFWNPVYLHHDPEYVRKFYRFHDEQGLYRLHEIIRTASMGPRPHLVYEYQGYRPEWGWRLVKEKVQALDAQGRLTWSKSGRPYLKRYLLEQKGTLCTDIWLEIPPLTRVAIESTSYPTQKPEALLTRIIQASSQERDVMLDPFVGSGTSLYAAQKLHRQWIGIDQSSIAIQLTQQRLKPLTVDSDYQFHSLNSSADQAVTIL